LAHSDANGLVLSPFSERGYKRGEKKVSGCANVPHFLWTEMKLKHKLENSGAGLVGKSFEAQDIGKKFMHSPQRNE